MNSQDFLILNVTCVGLFVLWYWRSRGATSKGPTKLNMHANDSAPLIIPPEQSESQVSLSATRKINYQSVSSATRILQTANAKNLNIIFNYNGHSWDAYEVLGVPAGSALPVVTAAYQKAIQAAEPTTYGFLETAYKSILHRF